MKKITPSFLHGVLLIALFALSAYFIADFPIFRTLSLSPMIIGILLGMIYANTLRRQLPPAWEAGTQFCSKKLLRIAIIFYGFRLTLQNLFEIGPAAILVDVIIVASVLLLGILIGKWLKMDRDTTILTASGSAICGAAAVLGTEPVLNNQPYKTAVAVTTVVLFGTLSMFVYPALYRSGLLDLSPTQMAIYTGSTLHEVAHVVGAGNAMNNPVIADNAVIVKMIRVILLAPVLIILALAVSRARKRHATSDSNQPHKATKITIPWFAIWFLVVILFNSFNILPSSTLKTIEHLDTFALTMAMCSIGSDANFAQFRKAGLKPFILAFLLFVWLMGAGYLMARYLLPAIA